MIESGSLKEGQRNHLAEGWLSGSVAQLRRDDPFCSEGSLALELSAFGLLRSHC